MGRGGFFDFEYRFIQGSEMAGTVVGGKLRCLLKLAGTPYFPDMKGKLLVLEAMGGSAARIGSGMAQLSQMGVFEQVNGILLGTFLEMEAKDGPSPEELILEYAGNRIPVAKTSMLGHRPDSCALVIGRRSGFEGKGENGRMQAVSPSVRGEKRRRSDRGLRSVGAGHPGRQSGAP